VGASDTWGPTIGYPEGDTPCMSDTLEFRAVRRRRHAAAAADSIEAARRAAHSSAQHQSSWLLIHGG